MSETFEDRLARIKNVSFSIKEEKYQVYNLYLQGHPDDLKFLIRCTEQFLHPYQNPWDGKLLTDPEAKQLIRSIRWQKMKPFIYFMLGATTTFAAIFMSGCSSKNIQTLRFDGQEFRCEISSSEWKEIHRGRMTLAVSENRCVVYGN